MYVCVHCDNFGCTHVLSGRFAELARNFDFFGAPVGLFFTIDRQMQQGTNQLHANVTRVFFNSVVLSHLYELDGWLE